MKRLDLDTDVTARESPHLDLDGPRLRAILATDADAARIQVCLDASRDYFVRTEGRAPRRDEAVRLLAEAEADPQRSVYVLTPREREAAVGILDLHLDYPEPGTVHIGLLLFREAYQGIGYGRETCEALEAALVRAGYGALRLSVVDENPDAKAFWERLGFWAAGRLDGGVTVYEKALADSRG